MGLLVGREREDTSAGHAVASGPYTYLPGPAHAKTGADTTLTRGDSQAALKATESLLQDFLDAMSALEADLARRWVGSDSRPVFARPE
ncbi:hypothetical protein [Streptomyces sp. NRRL S-340]|uniref:hypothetical protein n=1 Tax=Streptomyces sp. NRRL S-340 TaxID=1463901 RepID=UPI000A8EE32E|nr:hypothetical protein [Streptomyces sp. NRRL S-340]